MKRVVFLRNGEFAVVTVTDKPNDEVIEEFSHVLCLQTEDKCYIRDIPMKNADIKYLKSLLVMGGPIMSLFLGKLLNGLITSLFGKGTSMTSEGDTCDVRFA